MLHDENTVKCKYEDGKLAREAKTSEEFKLKTKNNDEHDISDSITVYNNVAMNISPDGPEIEEIFFDFYTLFGAARRTFLAGHHHPYPAVI